MMRVMEKRGDEYNLSGQDCLGQWAPEWNWEVEVALLIVDISTGLTINDVPKKNKKGKRVA